MRSGDWKLVRQPGSTELRFNLANDMSEKTDLLSEQPDKAKELRELLTRWGTGVRRKPKGITNSAPDVFSFHVACPHFLWRHLRFSGVVYLRAIPAGLGHSVSP